MTSTSSPAAASGFDDTRLFGTLVKVGRQLTAERDAGTQARLLCGHLCQTVPADAAAVILWTPQGAVEASQSIGLPPDADEVWHTRVRTATCDQAGTLCGDLGDLPSLVSLPLTVGSDQIGLAVCFGRPDRARIDWLEEYLRALADTAALAIQNARLHVQSHRDLRRRDALRGVVASISSELDLDALLGRIVASAAELLDADSGVISLVDQDDTARIRAVHNLTPALVGTRLLPGDGITGQVLERRQPVVVERYVEDLPRPLLEGAHIGAGVAVPVWWQNRLLGVFGVMSVDTRRAFSAPDREVMELFANHVAIALENARLYGEVRDRLAEVTGLQAASAAVAEALQPERALRVLAQQAQSLSGAATVSIELLDPGGKDLDVQVAVGDHAVELTAMRVPAEGSLVGQAIATGQPQLLAGDAHDSLLVLPLRARGRTLGTLSAYAPPERAFDTRDVDLLATFASQAAVSLDNAQLYGELQSRLDDMVGLQRLGALLLEEHDFDRVLRSICEQLQRLTDAGGVGLALLDEDPRFLEMRTVVGPSAAALRGARIPMEGSFAAVALRTNQPQRSDDAQNDPRGHQTSLVLGNTRTLLSVPMKTRQRTVGVLSVYNKTTDTGFTDRDAELATFFANQAAAAIENARLSERMREYAVIEERNRLARELHDSVTQSLFSVTLLADASLALIDRDPAKARERLERANELAQGALAEMRDLIFQLRPMTLKEEGLLSALRKHLVAIHSRHGVLVDLRVEGVERRLVSAVEDAAFRIIQETLNNVVKHARVDRAEVVLTFAGAGVTVQTVDQGLGFDPGRASAGPTFGMASMRERVESVGGTLEVASYPGEGTRIIAWLPDDPGV